MQSDLSELKIGESELEKLSGIALSDGAAIYLYWHFVRGKRLKIWSIIFNQISVFGLTLIISVPLALIIASNTSYSPDDPKLIALFLQNAMGLSLTITIGWNVFMWFKTKPLVALASLVEEVKKYNQAVRAVYIIDKLAEAGSFQVNLINREETIKALKVTRESLICALKTERILRENQEFIEGCYELFSNIENNLAALMAFDVIDRGSEYGRLLNKALEIGTNVHQELRKLQHRS